jgi:hypothetical protein
MRYAKDFSAIVWDTMSYYFALKSYGICQVLVLL